MKRRLAALLAGAMVITSLPMVSFAKTGNSIDRVPVVADDHVFTISNKAPKLTIKQDPDKIAGATFRLKLENAEWEGLTLNEPNEVFKADTDYVENVDGYIYTKLTDTILEVKVGNAIGDGTQKIHIPMLTEMGDEGDAKVTIDPMDSTVSSGTYTFAVVGSGDTVTKIEKVETITSGDEIKPIEIQETKVGVFAAGVDQKIELRLPNNFEWANPAPTITFSGGLSGKAQTLASGNQYDVSYKNRDKKILLINVKFNGSRDSRGSIIVSGLKINANNKAKYGDVTVKVSGEDVTDETITVAKYVDYQSTVKADGDPKEIYAGRYEGIADDADSFDFDDAHKLQKLIIEEDVANSWLSSRTTTISFPSWVRILGYEVNKEDKVRTTLDKNDGNKYDAVKDNNADESEVSFTATEIATGKKKVEITFYVSVEGDATGDITATVSGRSLGEEYEVVLGKAVAPVEVEVEAADVRIGRQDEKLNNITITESKAEAIQEGTLEVRLPEDFEWSKTPTVEVTDGDIEIDSRNVKVKNGLLTIPVKTDSRDASTIVISEVSVDLDRTIPEGEFKLEIGGDALVDNASDLSGADKEGKFRTDADKEGKFRTDYIAEVVFANVVTPNVDDMASGKTSAQKVVFTIGDANFTVGTEAKVAQTAPYINKDGRTMVSVKELAFAIGVSEANIKWDQATKTATVLGDRVVQVKIGSDELLVNGAVVKMDTKAEVKDGRTFIPVSYVASALGVPYTWDGATKTVTFN